jgi:formate hydrogenlyase transcriptional activator
LVTSAFYDSYGAPPVHTFGCRVLLNIKLGHTTLRPIAVKATAGSLEAAERAIILGAVEQCNWRIRGAYGAAILLDIKPTTLESRTKKHGLTPTR